MLESDQLLDFMINKWTESALTAKVLFNASHDIMDGESLGIFLTYYGE